MENALLISLSHQMVLKRRMDVVANNMANMTTVGFKSDSQQFEEHKMPVAAIGGLAGASARVSYVQHGAMLRDYADGPLEQTGNELDVAISGDGWFVVQTPEGERYTRNGQFSLDTEGQLVDGSGNQVLGETGPITFTGDEVGIEIAKDGTISTTAGRKDRFRLARFEDNKALVKAGPTLFASNEPALAAAEARVSQGALERSNVQPVLELTRMIETVRAYTHAAQSLQTTQDLRREAIERLGDTANS